MVHCVLRGEKPSVGLVQFCTREVSTVLVIAEILIPEELLFVAPFAVENGFSNDEWNMV